MKNFNDFTLSEPLRRAIQGLGFEQPSPIQAQAIAPLLSGSDLIGQARTGTGKTAAFAIPLLERVDTQNQNVQTLVLCPTRELALQVTEEFRKLAVHMKDVYILSIYGGQPIERQNRLLRRKPQIVVGTPGRVKDMIGRGMLKLNRTKTVVLDEADEMLNMGFRPDIERILKHMPSRERQTVFFSATMPKAITELARKFQHNAQHIRVAKHDQPVPDIEQIGFNVHRKGKFAALRHLLDEHNIGLALVFCNTKWQVDALVKLLKKSGYKADGLHGGKTQSQRDRVMQGFRKGKTQLLVATDVAARGLDINNVEAVFNFDLPKDTEFYIHRIGRTGRAGNAGRAFTFIQQNEFSQLRQIRKYPNVNLSMQELPALA